MRIRFRFFRLGIAIKFKNFIIDIGSKCMKKDIYMRNEEEQFNKLNKLQNDLDIINEEEKEMIKE